MKHIKYIAGLIVGGVLTTSIAIFANVQTQQAPAKQETIWINSLNLVNSLKHDVISFELVQRGETKALKDYYQQSLVTGFTLLEQMDTSNISDKYILTSIKELETWRSNNPVRGGTENNQLPMKIYSEIFPKSGEKE